MSEKPIGKVTHFFDKISVAALKLEDELKVGDHVHFLGHGADFKQTVDSMQIEGESVETAKAGDEIGMKVDEKAKQGTEVFLAEEESE